MRWVPHRHPPHGRDVSLVSTREHHNRLVTLGGSAFAPISSGMDFDRRGGKLLTNSGGQFIAMVSLDPAVVHGVRLQFETSPGAGRFEARTGLYDDDRIQPGSWQAGATTYQAPLPLQPQDAEPGAVELMVELAPGTVLQRAQVGLYVPPLGFVRLDRPVRLADTRSAAKPMRAGDSLTVDPRHLIPANSCAFVNITVTTTSGSGYLSLDGPEASVINWDGSNQTRANLAVSPPIYLADDRIVVGAFGTGATHVIVDLIGWNIAV
jgi:hypothetical protein